MKFAFLKDLVFNNNIVHKASLQKHLGLILDGKLNFTEQTNKKFSKAKNGREILQTLYHFIPRSTLLTVYKTCFCTHLDYGDVIYDQKIESVQYNAALAITGAIKETLIVKLYQELELERVLSYKR